MIWSDPILSLILTSAFGFFKLLQFRCSQNTVIYLREYRNFQDRPGRRRFDGFSHASAKIRATYDADKNCLGDGFGSYRHDGPGLAHNHTCRRGDHRLLEPDEHILPTETRHVIHNQTTDDQFIRQW